MTTVAAPQDAPSPLPASAPAIIRSSVRQHSIKVQICSPAIGAELSNVNLADAAQDPELIAEIRALWLKHKVLFFRDQDITPWSNSTSPRNSANWKPTLWHRAIRRRTSC